jgi:hypothetical protein
MIRCIAGDDPSFSGDDDEHLRRSNKDRARCKASSPDIEEGSRAMLGIIARHRRRIARDARHHRRRCITSSPDIEEGSRAMLGIIAGDTSHHRWTSKKDRARC